MANLFNYENKEKVILPNPMSIDKSIVRTTIIPSLLNIYDYNKARKVNDILLYEISKTYDAKYNEDIKIAILMKGNYMYNNWQNSYIKCDFYTIKGIVQNLLDYLGLKNRYTFDKSNVKDLHPGISANLILDQKNIGIIGKINPTLNKDDIYVCEISLNKIIKEIKPLKYKEASKYPEIEKDVAFIVKKDISSETIINIIKKAGGRLLANVEVFDLYNGENINRGEKSIAFKLTFSDIDRTLTEKEVMEIFNKIIIDVTNKLDAKLRN